MNWLFLIAAGLCEIFYAAAMPRTARLPRPGPSRYCVAILAGRRFPPPQETRRLPECRAYAVWVGIGAVGTAAYGMLFLDEDRSLARMACFGMIVMGIVGLKFLSLRGEPA